MLRPAELDDGDEAVASVGEGEGEAGGRDHGAPPPEERGPAGGSVDATSVDPSPWSAARSCDPPAGPKVYPAFTVLTNWIEAELSSDTTQWVCSGWAMTAHDPATGATARFVMTLTNDTTLSWLWQTHYWLDIAVPA